MSAGTLITAPGGHGTEYGIKIPTIAKASEAQAFVDSRISEGSDYIKIIYDDGKTYHPIPSIAKDTLVAVIDAAHTRGRLAVVHAMSYREAREAIESGANGLMHLFVDELPDRSFGRLLATRRAFAVPTLAVLEKVCEIDGGKASLLADTEIARYLSESDMANLKRSFPVKSSIIPKFQIAEETIRHLNEARALLLAGSDSATVHGALLHYELELLVRSGLSPQQALAAATSAPAQAFKLTDRGYIRSGLRADFVLVNGDPTRDIRDTRKIVRIWKQGISVDRAQYLSSLEREKSEHALLRQSLPPSGSESGLVSEFESELKTRFGSGWNANTDAIAGGKSAATFEVVPGGANDSHGALRVEGEIRPGFPFGWAGVGFAPGGTIQKPANLSSMSRVSFWAKGDGQRYAVMM